MKKLLLMFALALMALPSLARDFAYTYKGQTLTYTVISETAKTVKTKEGKGDTPGNEVCGSLAIPLQVHDGSTSYAVIEIGSNSFHNCNGLTSVEISGSITKIGAHAFMECTNLSSVSIPESVKRIDGDAFGHCKGLTHAEFASIESLCGIKFSSRDANPLRYARKLYIGGKEVKDVVIPGTVTSICDFAFDNCTGMTSVTIPESVTIIGSYAFYACEGLTSVCIPASVQEINFQAFAECKRLTSISFLGTGVKITGCAFGGCKSLSYAEFTSVEALCGMTFEDGGCNPLCYTQKLFIGGKEVKDVIIPGTVTSICDYAFYNCTGMTSVTIPESVISIGDHAFYACENLTSLILPESIIEIGAYAFRECRGISSVTIGKSVTKIGIEAFRYCTNLTAVAIPPSVCKIEMLTFADCERLASVIIPESVTEIMGYAFWKCYSLTKMVIPASVTSLRDWAFASCTGLETVSIPQSVTYLGDSAFIGCQKLSSVYYGSNNPISGEKNIFSADTYKRATLYMPEEGEKKAKGIEPWKNFSKIKVYEFSGIEEIPADIDPALPYEVYDLNGVPAGADLEALPAGIYVMRQGKTAKKVVVK